MWGYCHDGVPGSLIVCLNTVINSRMEAGGRRAGLVRLEERKEQEEVNLEQMIWWEERKEQEEVRLEQMIWWEERK